MFNIRVYGILINEKAEVLVSDEFIRGGYYTKFCGGGLEPGEGTIDCLKREFMEEMNLKVEVTGHLYTTDFYQLSAFNKEHQIISIYYYVKALEPITAPLRIAPFQFDEQQLAAYKRNGETETFRFIPLEQFSADSVTLPIDKIVADMVKANAAAMPGFVREHHILENQRARLEPLTESHFERLLPIALHHELWEFTSVSVTDESSFRKYFDEALNEKKQGLSYPFAIYDKKFERYAGSTRFGSIMMANKRLEIGWTWYHPELQRTGINKACKFLLLEFGFEKLGLNRVELKTSLTNIKSQGAMLKIGAVKEGVLRRHMVNANGSLRDSVYFSFIREDWPAIRSTIFAEY